MRNLSKNLQKRVGLRPDTQNADLLNYLMHYGSITRATAFYEIGITELSSRIGELSDKLVLIGMKIPREPITVTAKNGRKARVTQYLRPKKI